MNISTRAIVLNILNQLASIQYPPIDLNPPIYLVPTHLMYNLFFYYSVLCIQCTLHDVRIRTRNNRIHVLHSNRGMTRFVYIATVRIEMFVRYNCTKTYKI